MSEAHQLYVDSYRDALFGPEKEAAFERLMRAASLWREVGQHFSAAVAASNAMHAAWGRPDRIAEAENTALADFQRRKL
ncbi:MAG: hypothetical protein HY694_03285 [Deltaproteobacteria bacterium]|nr:hypothetical protein [Deltaproteobacteria bacterium]